MFLVAVVRRLLRRQKPMIDELYSKCVAIDHVYDGVAWVTAHGRVGYVNPALAKMLELDSAALLGRSWLDIFAPEDRRGIENAYSQMLLAGKASLDAKVLSSHGDLKPRNLLMVAIHDHKTRFSGHHCIFHETVPAGAVKEHLALAAR